MCICRISGVWIGSSVRRGNLCLDEKMEEAAPGETHLHAAACDWPGEPRGQRALFLSYQMHINLPLGQYEHQGGHLFVLQGWKANR